MQFNLNNVIYTSKKHLVNFFVQLFISTVVPLSDMTGRLSFRGALLKYILQPRDKTMMVQEILSSGSFSSVCTGHMWHFPSCHSVCTPDRQRDDRSPADLAEFRKISTF